MPLPKSLLILVILQRLSTTRLCSAMMQPPLAPPIRSCKAQSVNSTCAFKTNSPAPKLLFKRPCQHESSRSR